jgi:hypothetical protein
VLHATARALGSWHALPVHDAQLRALLCSWTILLSLEYCQQTRNALTPFAAVRPALRPCFIGGLLFLIIAMWSPTPVSFIYFQF